MITEQDLKNKCTPEFTKWMCELAEGFEWRNENNVIWIHVPSDIIMVGSKYFSNDSYFPLLIHRAVEGWNKDTRERNFKILCLSDRVVFIEIDKYGNMKGKRSDKDIYQFKNYQPSLLTQAECAELDCLLDIFKEEVSNGNNDTK